MKKKYNGGMNTEGKTRSPVIADFGTALNSSKATLNPITPVDSKLFTKFAHSSTKVTSA